MILVRPLRPNDRDWVRDRVAERWGSPTVVAHGVVYKPSSLPGFVAEDGGRPVGLLTFIVEGDECEIVTIDAFEEGRGVGATLIDFVKGLGHERLLAHHDERQLKGAALLRARRIPARWRAPGRRRAFARAEAGDPARVGGRNADPRRARIRVPAEDAPARLNASLALRQWLSR